MKFKEYFKESSFEVVYRALPFNADNIFRVDDYVTKSERFALEHAETSAIYNGEDYKVIRGMVRSSDIVNASNPGEYKMVNEVVGKDIWKLVMDDTSQTVSKERIRKVVEGEFDFGDDAQMDSRKEVSLSVDDRYAKAPKKRNKVLSKSDWGEARGFIELSGRVNRIGSMGHEEFSMDLGINGKKYKDVKEMCLDSGYIRWSPETESISIYREMTEEQIKVIKSIIKAYGYQHLSVECFSNDGKFSVVEFTEGDPSLLNAKMAGIQHRLTK